MPVNKRPSFVNFPIPFDHPYTLPTLMVAVATSSLLYYYLQRSHTADLVEAVRVRDISRRRHLKRPEDRFRSLKVGLHKVPTIRNQAHTHFYLKVEQRFVNPFPEWREVQWWETAIFWLLRWKGNGVPSSQEVRYLIWYLKRERAMWTNSASVISGTGQDATCCQTFIQYHVSKRPRRR